MIRKILLLAALGFVAAVPVRAADVSIRGCQEPLPGEVAVREVVADVGDTVHVAVTVSTTGEIGAFALSVSFPANLLGYVRTDPGELVPGASIAAGALPPAPGTVRIEGLTDTPVPPGVAGPLAYLVFVVEAAGSGAFSTGAFAEDLGGYTSSESGHSPTKIERRTWGAVKELYR